MAKRVSLAVVAVFMCILREGDAVRLSDLRPCRTQVKEMSDVPYSGVSPTPALTPGEGGPILPPSSMEKRYGQNA